MAGVWRHALIVVLLFFGWQAWDAGRYPVVTEDEVMLNEAARLLATHGTTLSPLIGVTHDDLRPLLFQPPGQTLVHALWYRVAGFGLIQTRIIGMVWGALCLGVLFIVAARQGAHVRSGWIAVALVGMHPLFINVSRFGRTDALALALMLGAFCVSQTSDRPAARRGLDFGAGLLAGAAITFHLVAAAFAAGMALWLAIGERRPLRGVVFATGVVVPLAAWAVSVWWFDERLIELLVEHGRIRSAAGGVIQRLWGEGQRWVAEFPASGGITVALAVPVLWAAWRRQLFAQGLACACTIALVQLLFNAFFMMKESGYYPIYPTTVLAVPAAAIFTGWLNTNHWKTAAGLLALAVVTRVPYVIVPRVVASVAQADARSARELDDAVRRHVPNGAHVWTIVEGWYAMAAVDASIRTPVLYGHQPDPRVDAYALLTSRQSRPDAAYVEVARGGQPIPSVWGRRFATSDYQFVLYRSALLTAASD